MIRPPTTPAAAAPAATAGPLALLAAPLAVSTMPALPFVELLGVLREVDLLAERLWGLRFLAELLRLFALELLVVRFAEPLLDVRVLVVPLRLAAGFPLLDPLARFFAVPVLPSAISHPSVVRVGSGRRATRLTLD
jgi:hypothetical protein